MTFHSFILLSATAGMTATLAMAESHDMATDRPNVGTYDGIMIEQGETDATDEYVVDELEDKERALSHSTTEAENVINAATPGTEVQSVYRETIGKVAGLWQPEGDDGYPYIIVDISESADIEARQLGFEVSALEATKAGALEYSNTLEHLREQVADAAQMTQ